jgi:hypothetical protein
MREIEKRMDEKTEKNLWKELKLLQPIIDKFDKLSLQIKTWFITTFTAVVGIAIVKTQPDWLLLNFFLILVFFYSEASYRLAHDSFLCRSRQIQAILRGEQTLTEHEKPPNLDKFLAPGEAALNPLLRHAWKMLRQPRASALYLLGVLVNLLFIFLFHH